MLNRRGFFFKVSFLGHLLNIFYRKILSEKTSIFFIEKYYADDDISGLTMTSSVIIRNSNARYVGTKATGDEGHSNAISRSGVTNTECDVSIFPTPRTSMRSHPSR